MTREKIKPSASTPALPGWGCGQSPTDPDGAPHQGHHVHDRWHGGNPTDWDNIIPYPKDLHQDLFGLYNQCYAGNPPWNSAGPRLPYVK
jgi:hypothetical protein